MKLQTFKRLFAFSIAVMMLSAFPQLLKAQAPCHNGVCPVGKVCINNHCVKIPVWCNCNIRPIPFECGQSCGWYTDPKNAGNLISVADGSVISSEINFQEIENLSFKIYDLTGKLIKTVADAEMSQNEQLLEWDKTDANGNSVSRGLYILQSDVTPDYPTARRLIAVN
jgi:hypothetical protein